MSIALVSRQGDVTVEVVQSEIDGKELAFAGEPPKAIEAVPRVNKGRQMSKDVLNTERAYILYYDGCSGCCWVSPSVLFVPRTVG